MTALPVEIVGLGEVLWDLLPGGRQLGGAPLNFAFHAHQLGHRAAIISRVGSDEAGLAVRSALRDMGLDDAKVQEDRDRPTGTVEVVVDDGGQPSYRIIPDVAWDQLAWSSELDVLMRQATVACFGTLGQRHPTARQTIRKALSLVPTGFVVCDLNLREAWYDRETIEASLALSRWLKLNHDELAVLGELLGLPSGTDSQRLMGLRAQYDLELVCMTRGARGCLVQTAEEEISVPGRAVAVVDTIGAGDAFTAGLVVSALEGMTIADGAVFANRLAARVAGAAGGTPRFTAEDLERLRPR